jgi:hypothetical protein
MADDRLLIKISALADGELAADVTRELEASLASDRALQREIDIYRKLDAAAANIPVPQIAKKLDSAVMRAAVSQDKDRLAEAALEMAAPKISNERFGQVWKKIAAQTVEPPAAEIDAMRLSALYDGELSSEARDHAQQRSHSQEHKHNSRVWAKLDEGIRGLSVPQLDELTSREAWHTIAEQTINVSAGDRRDFEKFAAAAIALPVPAVDAKLDRLWESIAERVYAPGAAALVQNEAVPAVSGEKWNSVWQQIQSKTRAEKPVVVAAAAAAAKPANVTQMNFKARGFRKRWAFAFSAAALLAVSALLFVFSQQEEQPTAMQVPEALDERYNVQVKYLEGQSEPVVCFFLKDDDRIDENNLQSFQWLPD